MHAQWQCIQASQYAVLGVVVGGDPNQCIADDQFGAEREDSACSQSRG